MMKRMLTLVLSAAIVGPAVLGQEPEEGPQFTSSDVGLHYYEPRQAVYELLDAALRVYGRPIWVTDVGDPRSPVDNIFRLDDKIVVYDTPAYARRVLEGLRQLDGPVETEAPGGPRYDTVHYTPSHVSLNSALEALGGFRRSIDDDVQNLQALHERSVVVMRDTPERLAAMTGLLERVDVPQTQAILTCYLLRPADEESRQQGESAPVPPALARNLDALTGFADWRLEGRALVRTATVADTPLELRFDETGIRYELELHPIAYSPDTGSMTLGRCRFTRYETGGRTERLFSTSTAIRGGEWTVLGAAGDSPYVALRIAPLTD